MHTDTHTRTRTHAHAHMPKAAPHLLHLGRGDQRDWLRVEHPLVLALKFLHQIARLNGRVVAVTESGAWAHGQLEGCASVISICICM